MLVFNIIYYMHLTLFPQKCLHPIKALENMLTFKIKYDSHTGLLKASLRPIKNSYFNSLILLSEILLYSYLCVVVQRARQLTSDD